MGDDRRKGSDFSPLRLFLFAESHFVLAPRLAHVLAGIVHDRVNTVVNNTLCVNNRAFSSSH